MKQGRPKGLLKKHAVGSFISESSYNRILQLVEEKKFTSIYQFTSKAIDEKLDRMQNLNIEHI